MKNITCTVIIPILNEIESIHYFLNSLYKQTHIPNEIIIVDGGSDDGTYEYLQQEAKKNKLKVFQLISNISEARNFAVKNAKYDLILCTDAGCKIDKNWCKEIIKYYSDNPKAKIVGGSTKYITENNFQKKSKIHVLPKDPDSPFFSSRNISFYKEVWNSVGGYPEYLTRWGEDTLFNYMCKKKGYTIYHCKKAIIERGLRKDFSSIYKMYRNYTHGDTEVFIINNIIQSRSIFQAIILWCLTLGMIIITFQNIVLGVIIWSTLPIILALHKNEKDYLFTLKFNLTKMLGIMIGFIKGIKSGLQIKFKL